MIMQPLTSVPTNWYEKVTLFWKNLFISFLNKLSSIFENSTTDNSAWSAMRFMTVSTVQIIIWTWAIISISKWELAVIPESVVTLFGLALLGKFAQAVPESKVNIAEIKSVIAPPQEQEIPDNVKQ